VFVFKDIFVYFCVLIICGTVLCPQAKPLVNHCYRLMQETEESGY